MTHKISIAIRVFFIILFMCCFAFAEDTGAPVQQQTAYALDDLYALALKNAEQIKISEENVYMAEKDKRRAMSVLFPTLNAFGSKTTYDETDMIHSDQETWGATLGYSFSLNGKELIALKMTKDAIHKSRYDMNTVKEAYLYQVAAAYYAVAGAGEFERLGNAYVDRLKKHKDAVHQRLVLGDATKTALFRAEAELSKARADLLRVHNQLLHSRSVLASLVGLEGAYDIKETDIRIEFFPETDLDSLKHRAIENRSDLKSSVLEGQIYEKKIKWLKSAYWPSVSIAGKYTNTETAMSFPGGEPGVDTELEYDDDAFAVEASISFTLFDGGLRGADIQKARAEKRKADLESQKLSKNIELEVEESFLDMTTYANILSALEEQLASSRQNYYAVSKEFQYGLADSIDVMDANTLLIKAEQELADSKYKYKLAEIKLKQATGTFLSDIIK